MIRLDVSEAKARLSEYLDRLRRGSESVVVICVRNVPVAELRALPRARARPRRPGGWPDLEVPASFFEPLPDDLLDEFEGRGEDR